MNNAVGFRPIRGTFRAVRQLATRARRTSGRPVSSSTGGTPWWRRVRSGVRVDDNTALTFSAVFAAHRIISETVAVLPFRVFETANGRRRLADDHAVDWIMNRRANPEMSAFEFRRLLTARAVGKGNGYAEIERDNAGRPLAMWPMNNDRVKPTRATDGRLVYEIRKNPADPKPESTLEARDVFHLRGLGDDGLVGYSVLHLAREAIGLGLAAEQFGATMFGRGLFSSGFLTFPGKLQKEAARELRQQFIENNASGPDDWNGIGLLHGGLAWEQNQMNMQDAQFLLTRKWQINDIARWFRVPSHMLNDLERATFSNIAHQQIEFVTHTVLPWACAWECEADFKMFGQVARRNHETKLDLNKLMTADPKTRGEFYRTMRGMGVYNANKILEKEDENPIPGVAGRLYLVQGGQVAVETLDPDAVKAEPSASRAPPPPTPTNQGENENGENGTGNPDDPMNPPGGAGNGEARALRAARAQSLVIMDAARRLVRKEIKAAQRVAAKGPAELRNWADTFYSSQRQHAQQFRESLEPAALALAEFAALDAGRSGLADAQNQAVTGQVRNLVVVQLNRSLTEIHKASEPDGDLPGLLNLWEIRRPAEIAEQLTAGAVGLICGES